MDVLVLHDVPDVDQAVLAGRCADGAVRADSDGVHAATVANKGVTGLEGVGIPDLDGLVPRGRDEERLGGVGREPDAGNPLAVTLESVLALTENVPQLDGLVTRRGDDLTVVGGEGDAEDVLGVPNKTTDGLPGLEVPETHGPVPAAGERVVPVVGKGNVLNKVGVPVERTEGKPVALDLGVDLPDHKSLVARAGDEGVRLLRGDSEAGDRPVVTGKSSTKLKSCHF